MRKTPIAAGQTCVIREPPWPVRTRVPSRWRPGARRRRAEWGRHSPARGRKRLSTADQGPGIEHRHLASPRAGGDELPGPNPQVTDVGDGIKRETSRKDPRGRMGCHHARALLFPLVIVVNRAKRVHQRSRRSQEPAFSSPVHGFHAPFMMAHPGGRSGRDGLIEFRQSGSRQFHRQRTVFSESSLVHRFPFQA